MGDEAPRATLSAPITGLAVSPDGTTVVACSQAGLDYYSLPDLKRIAHVDLAMPHAHDVRFDNASQLWVAGGAPGSDGALRTVSGGAGGAGGGDIRQAYSCGVDVLYQAAIAADGAHIAAAGGGGEVYLLDGRAAGGEPPRMQTLRAHSGAVLTVVFIGPNRLLTGGRDRAIRVWDVETLEVVRTLNNHLDDVRALAVRPGPAAAPPALPVVASASADRTVRLWQPTIGRLMRFARLDSEPLDLAWSPDGSKLLVGCVDGALYVIDPQTVKVTARHAGLPRGWAYAVAAVDQRRAVIGGRGGEVRLIQLD